MRTPGLMPFWKKARSSMAPPKSLLLAALISSAAMKTPVLWVRVFVPREVRVSVLVVMVPAVMVPLVSWRRVSWQRLLSES